MIAGLIKAKRNYNPSLVSNGEGFLLAYRSEPKQFTRSELVIAELDANFQVIKNYRINIAGIDSEHSLEDPRLFWVQGSLYIAFSIAHYGLEHGWKAVQAYGRLTKRGNGWSVLKVMIPRYGANDWRSKEKNWTFFNAEGALRCIYDMSASGFVILELDGNEVVKEWRHPPLQWRYGRMSGGTPAVSWNNQLLTVFHSWERHQIYQRIYHAGYVSFEPQAPHRPMLMSSNPIITAQEQWGLPQERWSPLCVFPGSLTVNDNEALVAYGCNDQNCAIDRFTINGLVRVQGGDISCKRRVRLTSAVMVRGQQAWAGTEVTLSRFDADSLIALGRAVLA